MAYLNRWKRKCRINVVRKELGISSRTGAPFSFPKRDEAILIAHVVADPETADSTKRQRFENCLEAIAQSFALAPHKIVILTKKEMSLHKQLPEYLMKNAEVCYSDKKDSMYAEFVAFDMFKTNKGLFHNYLFIEDDILIHDAIRFHKINRFNKLVHNPQFLLQPHRFEYYRGIKHYIDQIMVRNDIKTFYRHEKNTSIPDSALEIECCMCGNPHAAFYCLNNEHLELWIQSGYQWRDKIVAYGPLEPAATYGMFENFRFLQPSPEYLEYLEVQHGGLANDDLLK